MHVYTIFLFFIQLIIIENATIKSTYPHLVLTLLESDIYRYQSELKGDEFETGLNIKIAIVQKV